MLGKPWRIVAAAAVLLGFAPVQDGFERERTPPSAAAKNALEGKAPPAFVGDWSQTNGKTLDWKSLKGKVVLLDFWAHW